MAEQEEGYTLRDLITMRKDLAEAWAQGPTETEASAIKTLTQLDEIILKMIDELTVD